MSTNSLVAYVGLDGTVTSSYVHYDGYTTGVGEMLLENYNSDESARELATTLGYLLLFRSIISNSGANVKTKMKKSSFYLAAQAGIEPATS